MNVQPDRAAPRLHAVVEIARQLSLELGAEGQSVVLERARRLDEAGETEDARFWTAVARAMRLISPAETRAA